MIIRDFITMVGNYIRSRENSTELIDIEDMQDRLEALPSGCDTSIEDGLLDGTLTEYTNNRISQLVAYAFAYRSRLKDVSLGAVTVLSESCFHYCNDLISVNARNVTSIGTYAFRRCINLPKAYFPYLETTGGAIFWDTSRLKNVLLGNAKSLGTGMLNVSNACGMIVLCGDEVPTLAGSLQGNFTNEGKYIYVKRALIPEYEIATNWSAYAGQFRAIEDYLEDIVAIFPDFVTDFPQFFESEAANEHN